MNVAIFIYPNSGESWATTSPISGVAVPNHLIFPVGKSPSTSTSGTVVFGKLLDISPRSSEAKLLDNRGLEDNTFSGVGGIALSSDFTITLSNLDDAIDPYMLLGRTVKVAMFFSSATDLVITTNCRFVGYISDIDKSTKTIVLTISDILNRILHKEVGSEVKDGEIYPINYGTFDNTEMKGVFDGNSIESSIIVDLEELDSVTDLCVYDDKLDTFYKITDSTLLDSTNTKVPIESILNYAVSMGLGVDSSADLIKIYNPSYRAYLPTSSITNLTVGDLYRVQPTSGLDIVIKFISETDGYLVFEDLDDDDNFPIPASGTLNLFSGYGPASITYAFRSEVISPYLDYEKDETGRWTGSTPVPDTGNSLTTLASPCFIKVEAEIIQLLSQGVETKYVGATYQRYTYTEYECYRGANGTTAAAHLIYVEVTPLTQKDSSLITKDQPTYLMNNNKWLFEHVFEPENLSGLGYLRSLDETSQEDVEVCDIFSNTLIDLVSSSKSGGVVITCNELVSTRYHYGFDLVFPEIGIEGTIVNMYMYGKYEISFSNLSDSVACTCLIDVCKGGYPVPGTFTYPNDIIGGRVRHPNNIVSTDGTNWVVSDYPTLNTCSVVSPGVFSSSLPFFSQIFNHLSRRTSDGAGPVVENRYSHFDNTVSGRNNIKEFSLRSLTMVGLSSIDGSISSLSSLNSTRYFISLYGSCGAVGSGVDTKMVFDMASIGIRINFFVDLANTEIWLRGTGRVDGSSNIIESPELVLKDLLETEYDLTVTAETYPATGSKTTFCHYGEKRDLFSTIDAFCKQHGLVLFQDSDGTARITNCLIPQTPYTDIVGNDLILPEDWEQTYSKVDSLITSLVHKYRRRKTSDEYLLEDVSGSYTNIYMEDTNVVTLKNNFLTDTATCEYLTEELLNFYRRPIRELKINVIVAKDSEETAASYRIGKWYLIDSSIIPNASGKVYFLAGVDEQLPISETQPYIRLTLLELVLDSSESPAFGILEEGEGGIIESSDFDITELVV